MRAFPKSHLPQTQRIQDVSIAGHGDPRSCPARTFLYINTRGCDGCGTGESAAPMRRRPPVAVPSVPHLWRAPPSRHHAAGSLAFLLGPHLPQLLQNARAFAFPCARVARTGWQMCKTPFAKR